MTICTDDVGSIFDTAWPGTVVVGPLAPLSGGFWATMYRVRVAGQPADVPTDLVLRVAPDRQMGAKETEVQRILAQRGFATPTVRLSGDDAPGGRWWSVTDFAPGGPLVAGLDTSAVVRRAPSLLRDLPRQLGHMMAALHRIDSAPVTVAVRAAAPGVAWSVIDVLEHLRLGAAAAGRDDLGDALRGLADTRPSESPSVICHGDLHPFNVLADGDRLTVVDWTGAVCAAPAYDVAYTVLLLANPPLPVPPPIAAAMRPATSLLGRRFVAAYRTANPDAPLDGLDWYQALHATRILLEFTQLRAAHGPDAGGHPWRLVAPAAARRLSDHTGVTVKP